MSNVDILGVPDLYERICDYLSIEELTNCCSLNKSFNMLTNEIITMRLRKWFSFIFNDDQLYREFYKTLLLIRKLSNNKLNLDEIRISFIINNGNIINSIKELNPLSLIKAEVDIIIEQSGFNYIAVYLCFYFNKEDISECLMSLINDRYSSLDDDNRIIQRLFLLMNQFNIFDIRNTYEWTGQHERLFSYLFDNLELDEIVKDVNLFKNIGRVNRTRSPSDVLNNIDINGFFEFQTNLDVIEDIRSSYYDELDNLNTKRIQHHDISIIDL